jgi:cellulose synthase operon protein C
MDLAELLLEAGKGAEALPLLQRVREDAKSDPTAVPAELTIRAAYRLGADALQAGRFEDAATLLEEVCSAGDVTDTLAVSAGLLCADAMSKLGRHTQAVERLETALDRNPDSDSRSAALLRLGDAHASAQQWADSERAYAEHLESFPSSEFWFQSRFGLGWARENQGQHEAAIGEYRAVVERHSGPTAARAQFQVGECLYAMERHEEAARELLKVDILYAYPQWSAAALYEAGRCFEAMNDLSSARAQFEQVRERFPESRWSKLAIQRLEVTRAEPVPGR